MGHWGSNYNHWLWDELPRLFSALPYLPSELRFIVADDMTDAQRDSLHFLGISPERCVRQSFHGQTKVERLWFATPLGHSDQASTAPDVAFRIRQAFLEKCGAHTSVGRRRFFISRAKAKYRRLLNENEIMLQISKYGFECVQAENLTFKQQVRLFSEAEVILGQHGAGLTNMLFAPLHCKILEIHGPEVTRCHYLMMASILGHAYDCFVGQVPETSKTPTKEPDFLVDLISFKSWLKNALI
jgi:capsular polysaccharide biosynthesis protein